MTPTSQRREQIMQRLVEAGSVRGAELVAALGVSAVTVRGDLDALEAQGLITRKHGGATLVRMPPQEQSVEQKGGVNSQLKERIGQRAAQLVQSGDNIILDSGTTTLPLARALRQHQDVTVMTNGLNIAWALADAEGVTLLMTGGLLRKRSLSLQGAQSEACMSAFNFDKLFLGVDGLDLKFGCTTHDEAEARLNHKMVERAKRVIVLTDSSKFNRVSLHRIVTLDHVDTVITDTGIDAEHRAGLAQLGIEVIIVE